MAQEQSLPSDLANQEWARIEKNQPSYENKQSQFLQKKNEIKFELVKWIPPFYDTKLQWFYFCFASHI